MDTGKFNASACVKPVDFRHKKQPLVFAADGFGFGNCGLIEVPDEIVCLITLKSLRY